MGSAEAYSQLIASYNTVQLLTDNALSLTGPTCGIHAAGELEVRMVIMRTRSAVGTVPLWSSQFYLAILNIMLALN